MELSKYQMEDLEEIVAEYQIIQENYKRLETDPEFIYEVFDNAPMFFATLWETARRTKNMPIHTNHECRIFHYFSDDRELDFISCFVHTILKNYLNINIYEEGIDMYDVRTKFSEFDDRYSHEYRYLIETFKGIYIYQEDIEEYGEYGGQDDLLGCSIEFFIKVLEPIYRGKYDNYLEKLFKKMVIKENLTNK